MEMMVTGTKLELQLMAVLSFKAPTNDFITTSSRRLLALVLSEDQSEVKLQFQSKYQGPNKTIYVK
jgi:hypothetical protein